MEAFVFVYICKDFMEINYVLLILLTKFWTGYSGVKIWPAEPAIRAGLVSLEPPESKENIFLKYLDSVSDWVPGCLLRH